MLTARSSSALFAAIVACGLAASLATPTRADHQTPFSDAAFPVADWSFTRTAIGGGSNSVVTQELVSGGPDTARRVSLTVGPPSAGNTTGLVVVHGDHINIAPQNTFYPAFGDIASIDFSIRSLYVSGSGFAHRVGFLVEQNGVRYVHGDLQTWIPNAGWLTPSASVTASGFTRIDGLPGHPDFSSTGAPLKFGYRTTCSKVGPGAIAEAVLYDDFSVIVRRNTFTFEVASDAAWFGRFFGGGTQGSGSAQVRSTGGNPGSHLRITHAVNAGSSIVGAWMYDWAQVVNPSGGAVESIDMFIDTRWVQGPTSPSISIAIWQNGVDYYSPRMQIPVSTEWLTIKTPRFRATDFLRRDGLPGNPDFSPTGAPLTVGFRSRMEHNLTQRTIYINDYDNWSAIIHFLPCDSDFNGDWVVDNADFVIFASSYQILDCADAEMPAGCLADLNNDEIVDNSDFVSFVWAYQLFNCP